jgi:GR25 family glycosyltransferase involved in LPS biosynthesis
MKSYSEVKESSNIGQVNINYGKENYCVDMLNDINGPVGDLLKKQVRIDEKNVVEGYTGSVQVINTNNKTTKLTEARVIWAETEKLVCAAKTEKFVCEDNNSMDESNKYIGGGGLICVKIIHLARSKDRADHVNTVLLPQLSEGDKTVTQLKNVPCELFTAVDGKIPGENDRLLEHYKIKLHKTNMMYGQIGCFLSHFQIWENLINVSMDESQCNPSYLVLEDDTQINPEFPFWLSTVNMLTELYAFDPNWKWVYVWTNPDMDKDKNRKISGCKYIRPAIKTYGTVAYFISLKGAKFLTEYFINNGLRSTIDDIIMNNVSQTTSGFYTSINRLIDTVGPIYGHHTNEKLKSTIVDV